MISSSKVSVSPRSEQVRASQVALGVEIRLPGKEAQVRSLAQEGPLDKAMATHSSSLAWKIPWTEEPGGPSGHKESGMTEQISRQDRLTL